jgi:PAS domain S-box-containing protein
MSQSNDEGVVSPFVTSALPDAARVAEVAVDLERRRMEQDHAHMAAIVASSGDGIVSVEADGARIRSWSPGAARLFGFAETEAVGRTIDELIIPGHLREERARLYAAVGTRREAALLETVRQHKSGALVPVEINVSPMLGDAGRVTGYSVIFRGISGRRLASIPDALPAAAASPDASTEALAETLAAAPAPAAAARDAKLAAVRGAGLADGPAEPAYDQITRLVGGVLRVPVSLLTVLDGDRQFFVSSHGLAEPVRSARQTPLSTSYCRHVIESGAPLVIRNAEHNPLVGDIGAWKDGFVAYLGVPVRDRHGEVVASLCVADSTPRVWTRQDLAALEGIARLAMRELENRAVQGDIERSKALVQSVLESSPDCVKLLDGGGRVEFMNANGLCLMQIDGLAGVVGKPWESLWPEETRPVVMKAVAKARQGGTGHFQAFGPTAHGLAKWWDVLVAPVGGTGMPAARLVSVSRDITEHKRAEDALHAAHNTFRHLVNHSPFGIYVVDADFRLVQVSAGAQKAFETVRPLIGRDLSEVLRILWPEPFASEAIGRFRHTLATGEPYHAPSTMEPRKGHDVMACYDWKLERVALPDRRFGVVCHFYDLSERHRHEADLRASEERFRTFVNTAQEGIWAAGADGRTTFANPRMAEMLGTTPEAMAGKPAADFCFKDGLEDAQDPLSRTLPGQPLQLAFRFRRSDGTPIHLLGATSPLRGGDGAVTGALGGFIDLTERQRAEQRQHNMMLELAHRGKNLLAVIQSIANRTLTGDRSLADARRVFTGRLHALAKTYGSLTDEAFEGAPLDEIIRAELHSFSDQVRIDGPRIMLAAKVAQTFALVVHELATNAAKYGALSAEQGSLDVGWRLAGGGNDRKLVFEWTESGGPPAKPPTRSGFGSTLISAVAGREFKTTPQIGYTEAGYRYRFEAPLKALGAAVDDSPVRQKLRSDKLRAFYDAWTALKRTDGRLPQLKSFDRDGFAASGALTIAEADRDTTIRFREVGGALTGRLGSEAGLGDLESDDPDGMKEAYRRCARGGAPCYERLRFNFGGGDLVTFERLLVPFSQCGRSVTHIAGLVVYSGDTRSPREG